MDSTCNFAKQCLENLENSDFEDGVAEKSFLLFAVVVLYKSLVLFQWFVDMRTSLKVRLLKDFFLLQPKKFNSDWLQQHPHTPEEQQSSNSQTNGSRAGNLESLCDNQFLKKTVALEYKIT